MGLALLWASGREAKRRAERTISLPCRIALGTALRSLPSVALSSARGSRLYHGWQWLVLELKVGSFSKLIFNVRHSKWVPFRY